MIPDSEVAQQSGLDAVKSWQKQAFGSFSLRNLCVANIQLLVFLARFLAPNHHLFGCAPLRLAFEISNFKF